MPGVLRRRSGVGLAVLALSGAVCLGVAAAAQRPTGVPLPPAAATRAPAAPPADAVAERGHRPATLPASTPVSLAIPAIAVQTPLLQLGLSKDGTMEVPPRGPDYDKAGWYRHSPTPGALGPAVVAGHIDSSDSGPSVFFRLTDLRPRDEVRVTREDGSVAVFAVDGVQRVRKAAFPTALVYGDTDHAALRLITCGGQFDRDSGHYVDNIVVFASLVPDRPLPDAGVPRL